MRLIVESPGGLMWVVGPASQRRRKYGVPPGGPFDTSSAAIAQILQGNEPHSTILEVAYGGVRFRCEETGMMAIVGPPQTLVYGGIRRPSNRSLQLLSGQIIYLEPLTIGIRTYIALSGGVDLEPSDAPLDTSAPIPSRGPDVMRPAKLADRGYEPSTGPLRIVSGPYTEWLGSERITASTWTVSQSSNRVGLRLVGPAMPQCPELVSEPSTIGAIQLTPGGELLIHGPDGPTIGGYPKVGYVAAVDHRRLAQLRPGESVQFEFVSHEEAQALLVAAEHDFARKAAQLRAVLQSM